MIAPPSRWTQVTTYSVKFMVIDGDSWKWITMKAKFDSLDAAKEWCKQNCEALMQRYQLRFTETQKD